MKLYKLYRSTMVLSVLLCGCLNTPSENFVETILLDDKRESMHSNSEIDNPHAIIAEIIELHFTKKELDLMNYVLIDLGGMKKLNEFKETGDPKKLEDIRKIIKDNNASDCFAKFAQEEFQNQLSYALQTRYFDPTFEACKTEQDLIIDMLKNY